jgi:hypothetical protein
MTIKKVHHRFLMILPFIVLFCFVSGLFSTAGAEMFVYPAKGQSQEQQSKDEYACHQWAVQQTGFDPGKQQPVSSGKSDSGGGEVIKGGAVGALLGLGIGSLAGQSGAGAAVGAGAGALFGGLRKHDKDTQQEAAQQQAEANRQAMMKKYDTAKQACLEAKGYSVKQ